MDPVTAIGLASSIIAFVDFGAKIVKGTIEIYEAADGALEKNRSRETVALEMKRLTALLVTPEHSLLAGRERDLCLLTEKCRELSEKLLEWLERVKPKNTNSKRHSLLAALKNKYYESEREGLEKRLDVCRSQLALHVGAETIFSVDKLSEYVRDNAQSLTPLKCAVSELSRTGADTQAQFRQLLDIQKGVLHATVNARILAGLKFEGMHDRHDMVTKAHEKTFRWIFNVDDDRSSIGSFASDEVDMSGEASAIRQVTEEETKLKKEAREKFLQWLSSGSGIFHISGKMGSGKSTLMKFLSGHQETATRLEEWANGKQLVLASFFFWRPGSNLQKSLSGLYRTLLHDVLSFRPELIPEVFPGVWQRAMELSWGATTKGEFREGDIKTGFDLLVTKPELFANHSFCFFIDGLDEYQTRADIDCSDMVDELCRWTTTSPSHVKLCVSSREYPEFMNRFSPSQRLRVHTLTRFDIEAYVRDKLGHTEKEGIANLIESIVEKASGIFFWVSLVARDIREQLEIGVNSAHLVEIVDSFPNELDDLYRHILRTLSPYSLKRAYQTLTMMPFARTNDSLPLDLLAYSFLDEYNADPEFARGDKFDAELPQLRATEETRRCKARNILNGWCRGLVEADENGRLGYAHRSVADFWGAADIQEQMAASVNGPHPVSIFSELILAHLKVGVHHGLTSHTFLQLVCMRQEYCLDHAPFSFLRCLDALNAINWDIVEDPFECGQILVPVLKTRWFLLAGTNRPGTSQELCLSPYFLPELSSDEYVLWMILNDPKTTDNTSKAVLLFYAELYYFKGQTYRVLGMLLERGIITPSTQTHLAPFYEYIERFMIREVGLVETHSVWQYFLTFSFYLWLSRGLDSASLVNVEEVFGSIAEQFLQHGADPRFRFETSDDEMTYSKEKEYMDNIFFGDPSLPERFSYRRTWTMNVSGEHRISHSTKMKMQDFPWEVKGKYRAVSFRDWIQAMGSFPNKAALLQLVDDRMRELEGSDMDQNVSISSEQDEQTLGDNPDDFSLATATDISKALPDRTQPASVSYIVAVILLIISAILGYCHLCTVGTQDNDGAEDPTWQKAMVLSE